MKRLVVASSAITAALALPQQLPQQPKKAEKHEKQVVLQYVERQHDVNGNFMDVVLVPKDELVALGLTPMEGQAPLPKDALMICRATTELVTEDPPSSDIFFTCSGKRYRFRALDVH